MVKLTPASYLIASALAAAAALALYLGAARAVFSDTASNSGNTFATDTLDPPIGLTAAPGATEGTIDLSWTATADVQAWVNGTANNGWRINDQDETTNSGDTKYAARENTSASLRPNLKVLYTPP